MLKNMFTAGANRLVEQKEMLDALNVFPVPDGDTGTNMSFTVLAAAKETAACANSTAVVAKAASSGSLRGARGNSGVILSQLFRGFAKGVEGHETIDTVIFAQALNKASETAYRAVMKPKEGTMLTIGRELGEKAMVVASSEKNIIEFLKLVLKHGDEILKKTPDMLPVLKQAGVVDSGGKGLLEFWEGALACAEAGFIVPEISSPKTTGAKDAEFTSVTHELNPDDIEFAYCTEFLIFVKKGTAEKQEAPLRAYLDTLGDSVVVVGDDDVIKVHVHTNNPGLAIEKALTYGMIDSLKIDNMKLQAAETVVGDNPIRQGVTIVLNQAEHKPFGVVTVTAGEGFKQLFADIGVDVIIEGGQTMNPSAEDIAAAVELVNASHVFVLPNNKNIILAADQAKYLCNEKPMTVIPTKTIPQGVTAMLNYEPEGEAETIAETMNEAVAGVKTGQITCAVRDTVINDKNITEGDYLFIADGNIESAGKDLFGGAEALLGEMINESTEFITIYYGTEVDESDAQEMRSRLEAKYSNCEYELHNGGQPVYHYIFSVE